MQRGDFLFCEEEGETCLLILSKKNIDQPKKGGGGKQLAAPTVSIGIIQTIFRKVWRKRKRCFAQRNEGTRLGADQKGCLKKT